MEPQCLSLSLLSLGHAAEQRVQISSAQPLQLPGSLTSLYFPHEAAQSLMPALPLIMDGGKSYHPPRTHQQSGETLYGMPTLQSQLGMPTIEVSWPGLFGLESKALFFSSKCIR